MEKRCSVCGEILEDSDRFCMNCGAPVETTEPIPKVEEKHETPQSTFTGNQKALIALLAVIAGVLLVVLLLMSQGSLSGDQSQKEELLVTSPETTVVITTTTTTTTTTSTEANGTWYIVSVGKNNRLSLRAEPDEDSFKLDRIDNGEWLFITEVRGDWGKTVYAGNDGWVCLRKNGEIYCVME